MNEAPYVCYGGNAHCFCRFEDNHSYPKHERDGRIVYDSYQLRCCRCGYVALFKLTMEREA